MKGKGYLEKWAIGALGAVSLVLLMNLVLRSGVRAGASRPTVPTAKLPEARQLLPASSRGTDEISRYDPSLRLDLLKELQARALPKLARNPFEFEAAPVVPLEGPPKVPSVAAPPAGPPPVPLKALGYTEKVGGVREAIISDDEQIYVVHEGESFAKKFRVLKITPTLIEIEDESSHQTVRLPLAP